MVKIVLLTFLFASDWPSTFWYFCMSATRNQAVNFKVISNLTSLPFNMSASSNVQLLTMSLNAINSRISTLFNGSAPIRDEYPYKLCDFKPMFAEIFQDIIKEYDFWGHVDNDIVLGSLLDESFISDSLLANADIISSSSSMCNGPLQLYRNIPEVNFLYRQSKDLNLVVSTSKYYGFDENHGTLRSPHPRLIRRAHLKGKLRWNTTSLPKLDDRFYFRHGAKKGYIWSPRYAAV